MGGTENNSKLEFDKFGDRRILVIIVSDGDPDLQPTVQSALTLAAYPEYVRFAICHRFDAADGDPLAAWSEDPRFAVADWPEGGGANRSCAKARAAELFDDEPYVLHIAAHSRFAARWDLRFIEMFESVAAKHSADRAGLTGPPPDFAIGDSGSINYDAEAGIRVFAAVSAGPETTLELEVRQVKDLTKPGPSPLVAPNLMFTGGALCRGLAPDPAMTNEGEALSLSIRAFTHGYDMLYPNESLIWHRAGCGGDGFRCGNGLGVTQLATGSDSSDRLIQLLAGEALDGFGVGGKKSLADFSRCSGVDVAGIAAGADVIAGNELTIRLNTSGIDFDAHCSTWVFALLDADGVEFQRADITDADVLDGSRNTVVVTLEDPSRRPAQYVLWPLLASGEFLERRVYPIAAGDQI